jgi:hypothetical protein
MPKFTKLHDLAITIVIGVLKRAPCSPKQPASQLALLDCCRRSYQRRAASQRASRVSAAAAASRILGSPPPYELVAGSKGKQGTRRRPAGPPRCDSCVGAGIAHATLAQPAASADALKDLGAQAAQVFFSLC